MPKLWDATIEAHRQQVHEAIQETAAALVTERGLLSVTMSQIAESTGIGRATLYKYFPDVETILGAWHERHIAEHLAQLTDLRNQAGAPVERLEAVIEAYARIVHHRERHGTAELGALLHRGGTPARAEKQLHELFRGVLVDAAAAGQIRDDVRPEELTVFCLHALSAAGRLASEEAVRRLVGVTLDGLQPS